MPFTGPAEDRLAIRELIESYADAVIRTDAEAWGATWSGSRSSTTTVATRSSPCGKARWSITPG